MFLLRLVGLFRLFLFAYIYYILRISIRIRLRIGIKIGKIGLYEALLIADLMSKEKYFETRNELDDDGYFFNTRENIEKDTTLSSYQQLKAIKKLQKMKILHVKMVGLPRRACYKIDHNQLKRASLKK